MAKCYGKYAGVVVDNVDPEHRAHLKVKVPAVFGPELDVWARPCLPFGHFFVPEVDTKIWVEFEAGDTRFPIWVGVWYAQGEVPPEAELDPPTHRMIHTPSGHAVEFSDLDGEEQILLRHKEGSTITFDKEGNLTLTNKNGTTAVLEGDMLRIETASSVEVKSQQVTIDAMTINLGKDATEPAVLGQQFATLWNAFIFHTHPTAMGPSGPPVPPAQPLTPGNGLSTMVKVK